MGGPLPGGYFVRQNLDETGLKLFGVYPLAKHSQLNAKAQRVAGLRWLLYVFSI